MSRVPREDQGCLSGGANPSGCVQYVGSGVLALAGVLILLIRRLEGCHDFLPPVVFPANPAKAGPSRCSSWYQMEDRSTRGSELVFSRVEDQYKVDLNPGCSQATHVFLASPLKNGTAERCHESQTCVELWASHMQNIYHKSLAGDRQEKAAADSHRKEHSCEPRIPFGDMGLLLGRCESNLLRP